MSNVDLLLDLGGDSNPSPQNGTSQSFDPLDPFAPTTKDSIKTDSQNTNGATDSFDPFSTKSSDSNPLYDFQHGDSANPLFEFQTNGGHMQSEITKDEDYQELQSPTKRDDYNDYQELITTQQEEFEDRRPGKQEIERQEETYVEEDGTFVTVTTVVTVDADGNTYTEVTESRTTQEEQEGDEDDEEVIVETHEEFIQEGPDGQLISETHYVDSSPRQESVSSDEGGEPYSQGVTMETVYSHQSNLQQDCEISSSNSSNPSFRKSIPLITITDSEMTDLNNSRVSDSESLTESDSESEVYEDGEDNLDTVNNDDGSRPSLASYADQQNQEYTPPKRYEKTESNKKQTGPQYTIMSEYETTHVDRAHKEEYAEDIHGMPPTPGQRKSVTDKKPEQNDRAVEVVRENEDLSGVTGDTEVNDGLDSCKSLGNLKSRFEGQKDEQSRGTVQRKQPLVRAARPKSQTPEEIVESPVVEEKDEEIRRDPNIIRETKDKEEIRFAEMASFKSRFETQGKSDDYVPFTKKTTSTRRELQENKPVPPPVNRTEDGEEIPVEDDLPTLGTSKNLVAKFKSMESGTAPLPSTPPQPKRITPPREEARSVSEDRDSFIDEDRVRAADKQGEVIEEELPTPGTTKNIFAKFKSMEAADAAPPTPERQMAKEKPRRFGYGYQVDLPKNSVNADVPARESPQRLESGEFENTPAVRTDVAREHDFTYEMNPEGGEYENTPEIRTDLVKEEDTNMEEELPEQGMAKNLLARFKQLEDTASKQKEYKPSGIGNKATPTPLRPKLQTTSREDVSSGMSDTESMTESQHSLGGDHESTPQVRHDVLRETDHVDEEELPEEGLAKNLLARFKSIESSSPQIIPLPKTPTRKTAARKTPSTHSADADSGIYESEPVEKRRSEPTVEGGEYENTPEQRDDLVRETHDINEEELPEQGTTRNILARFQAMQTH